MMETVEDIPRDAILDGLPWDWEDLRRVPRRRSSDCPRASNVGGMVGHCARAPRTRWASAASTRTPATADDIAAMCEPGRRGDARRRARLLDVAHAAAPRARRPSGARHVGHAPTSCFAFADVLGRHGRGRVRGRAPPRRARRRRRCADTRAEVAWMGEVSRRVGPAGHASGWSQSDRRPDLYAPGHRASPRRRTRSAAQVRPQTTARGVGILFGLANRTPFDRSPAWQRAARRCRCDEQAGGAARPGAPVAAHRRGRRPSRHGSTCDSCSCCRPAPTPATTATRRQSLAAHRRAARRVRRPRRSSSWRSRPTARLRVQLPVPQPAPRRGRGDARRPAGHAGPGRRRRPRRPDHGRQPADVLPHYWVRERQRWALEEARPPADLRHRRAVRHRRPRRARARARSPTST